MVTTNNWDGVPWSVGGGAEHSTNIARLLAYVAFRGQEGIIGPRDLEVRELAVPGTSVRVFKGAGCILNRAANIEYEAYAARLESQDTIDIAATGAGQNRSDLIVARVENPHIQSEPWDPPADLLSGPYIATRVISGVPDTVKTHGHLAAWDSAYATQSLLPLARIDLPPLTGTVIQNYITDLRQMSEARSDSDFEIKTPTVVDTLGSAGYTNWPSEGNVVADVPEWATHAAVQVILGGVRFGASGTNGGAGWNVVGDLRIQLGVGTDAVYSQATGYNESNEGGVDRTTLMAGAPLLAIPAGMRGKSGTFRLEGRKTSGTTSLQSGSHTTMSFLVEWKQQRETNL